MKKEIKIFTAASLLSVILLMVAGALDGALSTAVYCLAFLAPTGLGLVFQKKLSGDEEPSTGLYLVPKREKLALVLPCIAPTIALVLTLSFLTSLIITATTGAVDNVDVGDDFFVALLLHALLPALFEEALFRYLPLRLFGERAPRVAVVISAAFFALAHVSLFRIPYAFVAGAIFMVIDLVCESPLPSAAIHFANNLLSLLWIFFGDSRGFLIGFLVALSAAVLISLIFILRWRRDYAEAIRGALRKGESWSADMTPMLYAVPTLMLAITDLM